MTETHPKKPLKSKLRSALGRVKYISGGPRRWAQQATLKPFGWLQGGAIAANARLLSLSEFTPELVLGGYVQGAFPTGEPNGSIVWHCPLVRAVIDTSNVHVSRRLKGYLNKDQVRVSFNHDFEAVIEACADRKKTWITADIRRVYQSLHGLGFAHSVEAWSDDRLVGGGYGVALGNVFFLESMFCRENHASKIAFVHLARKLAADGFTSIDCQFLTEHWRRFGAQACQREVFQSIVTSGLIHPAVFSKNAATPSVILPGNQPLVPGSVEC